MGARRRLGLVVAMGVIKLFTRAGGSQALTYVSFLRFAFPPSLCFAFSAKQQTYFMVTTYEPHDVL